MCASGKPVSGVELNLAAVDEALFSVASFSDYATDILSRIYDPLPSGIIRTYASHQYPVAFSAAGGRGGGSWSAHCNPIAASYDQIALKYEAMAADHRQLAAQAKP